MPMNALAHPARTRCPCAALAPIPEAPECSGKPEWERGPASSERTGLSESIHATTPQHCESSGAECAAKRAVVKRELPAWRSVVEWPEDREAFGRFTLKASADTHAASVRALCRIRDGVLTLDIEQRAAAGEEIEKMVAELPVEALAVGLQRGRANMLTLATVGDKGEMFDEIYCFCDNPVRRNKWIAVFRRMGVAVFDLRD